MKTALPRRRGRQSVPLVEIRAFIDRNYVEELRVDTLAVRAGLSTFHFIRAFRKTFGSTPHRYVRARRIERARELLVTTPLPVTEVCEHVGFSSLGSFSSLFRRATGESPAEFRAKRRKPAYIPGCFIRMFRAE